MSTAFNPMPHALFFEIEGVKFYVDIKNDIDYIMMRLSMKRAEDVNWVYFAHESIFFDQVKTAEATDAKFSEAVDKFNRKLVEYFGKDESVAPESGEQRLIWLVKNKLEFNDKLVIKG